MIFPNGKPTCDECLLKHNWCNCMGIQQCSTPACDHVLDLDSKATAKACGEFIGCDWYCADCRSVMSVFMPRYPWDADIAEDMNKACTEKMTNTQRFRFIKERTDMYAAMYGVPSPFQTSRDQGDLTPRYFLTFTYNGNHEKQTWLDAVKLRLGRKDIKRFISGVVEHPESNIHVHAYVESDKNWTTNRTKKTYPFHSFEKNYGHVDVKRVKNDNGISDYIQTGKVEKIEELKLAI